MDLADTQIYEDEDFLCTQRFSQAPEEKEFVQVGTLSIDSTDYQIKIGTTKIGRHSSCDIVIRNGTISKLHAEIEASRSQGSVWICDMKSSNRTKLNNLLLQPNRAYELKDESNLEFGEVCATYRTYRPADDVIIPETPGPSRQKIASTIIPNTPDSSLNNSSGVDDGSIILGTQKDEESSIFRRPRVLQQRESTSIGKKNISCASSMNEGDDSRITTVLHTSDVGKDQVSIYEVETQNVEEGYKMASNSIHDMETQGVLTDMPEHLVEAKADKQLLKLNICDKAARGSITDIHDIETQNCIDNINEIETQKNKINISNVTGKKFTKDIHNVETQHADENSDTQKSGISKKNSQEKNLAPIERDIHDAETQKYIAENISDLETQLELNNITGCNHSKDISDMETQLEADNMTNEINNDQANKDKDKDDIANTTKDGISHENITKSSKSRSSSPGSLNLSSPGVDEDERPSSLDQSDHLLESSDLLEFFSEGIDKQEEAQTPNMSTPKPLKKVSSKRDSNVGNVRDAVNNEENDDEDIFEALTQHVSRSNFEALMSNDSETNEEDALIKCKIPEKKKRGKPQSKQTNDDSETDAEEYVAELAKKQREHSSGTLNKSNENINNRNDPGTSIESEDMFDAPTQRLDELTTKDTNSLLDQPQEANEIVNDMASTQIINNVDQDNLTNMPTCSEINDVEPTQLILPCKNSSKIALNSKNSKDNQNDIDDMATTQIINTKAVDCGTSENLDREDADYELAPTQVIGEIEDKEKRDSTHEKDSSQVNLNDTLEQKLSEMFADVNNDTNSIHESPHMSTQYLEDILESPQCDDSTNKSIDADIGNVRQKQLEKKNHPPCNQHSDNLLDTEVNANNNVNKTEIDSQMSDVYFSTITTRRKRNILRDTQELIVCLEDINPSRQDVDSSRASKANNEKTVDDTVIEVNKQRKRISKTKTLNDDNKNETVSNRNNQRSLRSTKKQKDETTSETNKQVLEKDSAKSTVDDAEENISICIPCPSKNGQGAQMLNASYEIDDDILMRLPAVRISGTLSNPASPSASSMSTVYSPKSKQGTSRSKKRKGTSLRRKSLREWDFENSGKNDKPSVDDRSNSVLDVITTTDKISGFVDSSEESDSETKYKRFQQMADRVLNTELSFQKRQDKRNRKNSRVSQDISEDPKQNTDVEFKNPMPTTSRMTRHSSKRNNESDVQKEVRAKNAGGARSTEPETKSAVKRKTSLNIEESVEQINLKKRKTAQIDEECPVSTHSQRSTKTPTDRQSPNILKYLSKMSSRESSPIIENTKSSEDNKAVSKIVLGRTQKTFLNTKTDENVDSGGSIVKQARSIIYDCQVTIRVNDVITSENSKKNSKNNPAQTKETEASQSHNKILKVLLNPIKSPIDDGSQEVERIMAREPSNTQDKNLSIRESSSAKIFRRELRSRKRSNLDIETESVSNESGMSSEVGDSDNTQLDNNSPLRNKYGRFVKRSVSSQSKAQMAQKKGTFKKPTRITHNQNSASLIFDSSTENMIGESSQGSTESDASTSSRVSRSKAASIRKKEMMESNQNTRRLLDDGASVLNTSAEVTSLVLTPSRTRRSTSILNNSTPSVMKQNKILFTGITEDYSEVVKTLGGKKVEDPANCNVLVTDKVRRTYKFLCALAKGIPIVSIDWLRDSETAAQFLEWENYILKDPASEAKFGFKLRKSLDIAKKKRLLDGYTVVLTPNVALPPIEELKDMVSSCGGKALLRPPTKWPKKAVVLSREEDLPTARKYLAKAPKNVTVQSTEFILTGILRQETDFDKYKLT